MKMSLLLRFRRRLLRRRNEAQQLYQARPYDCLDHTRTRLDSEVETLDKVLDGLDRLVKNNQDRWHDRRKNVSR